MLITSGTRFNKNTAVGAIILSCSKAYARTAENTDSRVFRARGFDGCFEVVTHMQDSDIRSAEGLEI